MEGYLRSILPEANLGRVPSQEEIVKVSSILSCFSIQDIAEEETRLME